MERASDGENNYGKYRRNSAIPGGTIHYDEVAFLALREDHMGPQKEDETTLPLGVRYKER